VTGTSEHDFGSCGASFCCMAREIMRSNVRFGLNDPADGRSLRMLAHEVLAYQLLGDVNGILFVERAWEFSCGTSDRKVSPISLTASVLDMCFSDHFIFI
jgi:hypothetical protein